VIVSINGEFFTLKVWFGFTVFNATFINISVISWWSVLLVEKTTDLSQVSDKLYHKKEIERSQWLTPTALRNWLQLSHEIELDYFNRKKFLADDQLRRARDEVCT
jgi:hypothetical protein